MTLNLLLILTALAASQPTSIQPSTEAAAAAFRKGSIDWSVLAGGALPVDLEGARSDRRLTLAALELGRVMSGPHGPGPLRGQFEMLIQVMPVIVRGPEEFWGVGISPLFLRWTFSGIGRVRPFAEASAGLMFIDWAEPGISRVARNFNEQAGFGVRVGRASGRGLIVGYRFQHISNGDPDIPSPAIDTHLAYVGFSLVR
jgi:hypothetical protein